MIETATTIPEPAEGATAEAPAPRPCRRVRLVEIFDRDTANAVIVSDREVSR